jgi:hypothetical protein
LDAESPTCPKAMVCVDGAVVIVNDRTRRALAFRRQERALLAEGYRRHETDWEIHRGFRRDHVIVDARVSVDGKYVYTKLGKRA